jgi:NAD(P)H dehydrogenase (quinone)
MNALIIYSHPKTGGFCEAILEETKEVLAAKNISAEILDLYTLDYNPVLLGDEHYTRGNKNISQQTSSFQDSIRKSDLLIFIYPIWWGTMPAILKGFFDKTFVSGFGFEYRGKIPVGLLKGKKSIVMFTSGAPSVFSFLFQANRPKKHIEKDILGFCGIKAKAYQFGSATSFSDNEKERIKKFVGKALKI